MSFSNPLLCIRASLLAAVLAAAACVAEAQPSASIDVLNKRVLGLYLAGKYREAAPIAEQAREQAQGQSKAALASALTNLALLRQVQARYDEAEALFKESLSIRTSDPALGPDSREVAWSKNYLAELYREQDRLPEAKKLLWEARTVFLALDKKHADVGTVLNNLGQVYRFEGDLDSAQSSYDHALKLRIDRLGPEHPDVGTTLNNLGQLKRQQGRYDEAEARYKSALSIREKALGAGHRDVGITRSNLGLLYRQLNRFPDAEKLYMKSLSIWTEALGPEHPLVGRAFNHLGQLYRVQGRYDEARLHYGKSLSIRKSVWKSDHSDVGVTLRNLARLHAEQKSFGGALPLYEEALGILKARLGAAHPLFVEASIELAELHRLRGQPAKAEALFSQIDRTPGVSKIVVVFATNREPATDSKLATFLNARSEKLRFGHSILLAARDTVQGSKRKSRPYGIDDVTPEESLFVREVLSDGSALGLKKRLDHLPEAAGINAPQAVVFIHGFNVGFEQAVKRAGQIAFDLEFDGPFFLFTWPSRETWTGYIYDAASATIAAHYLVEFLDALSIEMPKTQFHIVAHSMGNLVAMNAIREIGQRAAPANKVNIGEVVFAHPDVDRDHFKLLATVLGRQGRRMTLYTSRDDWALWLAEKASGVRRPGGGAENIVPGVDTMDISGLGTSFWSSNHSIYAANPVVFGDISRLLLSGTRPPHRRTSHFEPVSTKKGTYWRHKRPK